MVMTMMMMMMVMMDIMSHNESTIHDCARCVSVCLNKFIIDEPRTTLEKYINRLVLVLLGHTQRKHIFNQSHTTSSRTTNE